MTVGVWAAGVTGLGWTYSSPAAAVVGSRAPARHRGRRTGGPRGGLVSHAPRAATSALSISSAVCSAAGAGAGPAVLSELVVRDEIAAGRLVDFPATGVELTRSVRAVWRRA